MNCGPDVDTEGLDPRRLTEFGHRGRNVLLGSLDSATVGASDPTTLLRRCERASQARGTRVQHGRRQVTGAPK
jgi:hypothetical protein